MKINSKNLAFLLSSLSVLAFLILGFTSKKSSTNERLDTGDSRFVEFAPGKYVSKYETTNGEFKNFLNDLKDENLLREFKPDSTLWVKKLKTGNANSPMEQVYFSHNMYDNYPVTCISKNAMIAFCEWKTSRYVTNNGEKKVVFRLPTSQEWQIFASPILGYKYPWREDQPYVANKKGAISALANLKIYDYSHEQYVYMFDNALYPIHVKAYQPNSLGLYNIIGNVAEYTSDDLCKGGGFDNTMEECAVQLNQKYDLPNPSVGFRIIMEIKS